MKEQHQGILRIGTSGIVVPGGKQSFPAEFLLKSRLYYYGSLFNTLEVNSTFKKVPLVSTFEKWSLDVPLAFQFTIKLWKEVTHAKQLNADLSKIDSFVNAAAHIGNKKGCLLIQFPGSITVDYFSQVENILRRLQQLDKTGQWRKAVEFRSLTWHVSETNELLNEYSASMVLHDMPKSKNFVLNEEAKFAYYRFHGPTGDYRGSYTQEFLQEHSGKIRLWLKEGKDVYAYFNNTMGNAFENAMSLKAMVER